MSTNKCRRCLSERQYFSTPLPHAWQGRQHCIVLFLHGRGSDIDAGSVCNCYCWRENGEERESQCVRGLGWVGFWCARWITSRVCPHVCLLYQLVSSLASARWWNSNKSDSNHCIDCGRSGLCIQANLIIISVPNTLGQVSFHKCYVRLFPKLCSCRKSEGEDLFSFWNF